MSRHILVAVRQDFELVSGYVCVWCLTPRPIYIVRKTASAEAEGKALDWLLGNFSVIPADAAVFRLARASSLWAVICASLEQASISA